MIINTFISDTSDVPAYTEISLKQARKFNPETPIHFICKNKPDYFEKYNIEWIPQDSVNGDILKEFNNVCWFNRHGTPSTSYPSPEGFWHKTCERIFYLYEYIKNTNDNVCHFENDVLIYYPLENIKNLFDGLRICPMSRTQSTFAITLIKSSHELKNLCKFFIDCLKLGEVELYNKIQDHISEMSLLTLALNNGLTLPLPILLSDCEYIFDPGSYGQYLGGTNNFHNPGFIDEKHYIGQKIANGLSVEFKDFPLVGGKKLFNLHIHSKNLERFKCF